MQDHSCNDLKYADSNSITDSPISLKVQLSLYLHIVHIKQRGATFLTKEQLYLQHQLLQLKSNPPLLDITERMPNKGGKMSTFYKQFYYGPTNDPLLRHYIYTYNTILPL